MSWWSDDGPAGAPKNAELKVAEVKHPTQTHTFKRTPPPRTRARTPAGGRPLLWRSLSRGAGAPGSASKCTLQSCVRRRGARRAAGPGPPPQTRAAPEEAAGSGGGLRAAGTPEAAAAPAVPQAAGTHGKRRALAWWGCTHRREPYGRYACRPRQMPPLGRTAAGCGAGPGPEPRMGLWLGEGGRGVDRGSTTD